MNDPVRPTPTPPKPPEKDDCHMAIDMSNKVLHKDIVKENNSISENYPFNFQDEMFSETSSDGEYNSPHERGQSQNL